MRPGPTGRAPFLNMRIDTLLSPAELPALARRDLSRTACVVFDILRATSTFVTALHHGAAGLRPVGEIAEAVAVRRRDPQALLAGEREGLRLRAEQTGGTDFDFGNSPREFIPEAVRDKTIVSTTTNGTRALRAAAPAKTVLAASLLNLAATADFLRHESELLILCAGTGSGAALEDVLAAGALIEALSTQGTPCPALTDSAEMARLIFAASRHDLAAAFARSENGRRLLSLPELAADVAFCCQTDVFNLVARMDSDEVLRRVCE